MSKQRNYIYLRRSANICMQLIFQAPTTLRTTTTTLNQTNRSAVSASQKHLCYEQFPPLPFVSPHRHTLHNSRNLF